MKRIYKKSFIWIIISMILSGFLSSSFGKPIDLVIQAQAKVVIPDHGDVTNMKIVTKYTKDYLIYLRDSIKKILENDGDLNDAYKHLDI
jgi:hypothetical protein